MGVGQVFPPCFSTFAVLRAKGSCLLRDESNFPSLALFVLKDGSNLVIRKMSLTLKGNVDMEQFGISLAK